MIGNHVPSRAILEAANSLLVLVIAKSNDKWWCDYIHEWHGSCLINHQPPTPSIAILGYVHNCHDIANLIWHSDTECPLCNNAERGDQLSRKWGTIINTDSEHEGDSYGVLPLINHLSLFIFQERDSHLMHLSASAATYFLWEIFGSFLLVHSKLFQVFRWGESILVPPAVVICGLCPHRRRGIMMNNTSIMHSKCRCGNYCFDSTYNFQEDLRWFWTVFKGFIRASR